MSLKTSLTIKLLKITNDNRAKSSQTSIFPSTTRSTLLSHRPARIKRLAPIRTRLWRTVLLIIATVLNRSQKYLSQLRQRIRREKHWSAMESSLSMLRSSRRSSPQDWFSPQARSRRSKLLVRPLRRWLSAIGPSEACWWRSKMPIKSSCSPCRRTRMSKLRLCSHRTVLSHSQHSSTRSKQACNRQSSLSLSRESLTPC